MAIPFLFYSFILSLHVCELCVCKALRKATSLSVVYPFGVQNIYFLQVAS